MAGTATDTETTAGPLVSTPLGWTGRELATTPDVWTHNLTAADVAELDGALAEVRKRHIPPAALDREAFALPTLGATAAAWAEEVMTGRGFVVIRGLPVDRWTVDEARLAFAGLGSHIGVPMPQNAAGDRVADVRAEHAAGDPGVRRYETSEDTPFHTDGSDMIALFCLRQGRAGGRSAIVSSVAVVNAVHRARPDLVPLLAQPWPFAMTQDATEHFELPLLGRDPFSFFYIRWYIEQSQLQPDVRRLTGDERTLLDLVDAAAADARLDIDFAPGDVQLLSNRVVMHARSTFVDWDEPARKRHLLRLWLARAG
jgi:hypothetical protein